MPSKPLFTLATYFARRNSENLGAQLGPMPPRPDGTVIWVWATSEEQIVTLRGLEEVLREDGDQITLVITLRDAPDYLKDDVFQAPRSRAQTQAFLTHWRPGLVVWMRDGLDPSVLVELDELNVPCMLIEATKDVLTPKHGGWVPGLARAMLMQFVQIMTLDAEVSTALLRAGADPNAIEPLGAMETTPPALMHFEDERMEMAKALGARPIWFAVDSDLEEADMLATAHQQASRRSHRLLLIVSLRDAEKGDEMAQRLRSRGFLVALRSADEEPDDATQVYVVDTEGELGLWYRLAPITYLGGTLSGGPCRNPYEAATLGSALLHGPDITPYQGQARRLGEANACVALNAPADLGNAVERLLAPDKTALIVHGAWEVTSRGAEVTTRVAEAILAQLDAIGA